jgi:hypothetical protein
MLTSKLRIVQAGGDQQHAVGADGARLVDLVGIDHEVLAQHGQGAAGARLLQIVDAALEELPVCQHREAGGADLAVALGVALRDVGGDELLADHALAGAGLLDLGDHAGLAGRDPGAQRAHEVAREHTAFGVAAHVGEGHALLGGGHFLDFHVADLLEDVGHGAFLGFLYSVVNGGRAAQATSRAV